ncbi:DUF2946 family protein [Dechloromonas sp. ZY10]|uniref:DUF2946 family protein n=1 Tax=Dechloromonas aquae TaxID=2664436 RepID=UPI0035294171
MNAEMLTKWPDVPACYEWLALDRRGQWRLRGERVTHGGLIAFLNHHYEADADGCWRVLNGPQRVYVDLALTPWVYRREGEDFVTHTGLPAGPVAAVYLTAAGEVLLAADPGIGLLDDRDLPALLAACRNASGGEPPAEVWEQLLATAETAAGLEAGSGIFWGDLPLQLLPATCDLGVHFGFCARPRP